MHTSITLTSVCYAFPDSRVLFSDLSLALGLERAGLVGRNGVGKSCLLHLIGGLLPPASGRIVVDGRIALIRQSLAPRPDETLAALFGIKSGLARLARIEAGQISEADLAPADRTLEPRFEEALAPGRIGGHPR